MDNNGHEDMDQDMQGGHGHGHGQQGDQGLQGDKAAEYMKELLAEKLRIDQTKFPIAVRLIEQEVNRVQALGRVPLKDPRYVDIYREKPIKVSVKVLVPVQEHPKFNFVGKLLGPKGNSMKRLQEETMCKMAVLGRGSMKDRQKEEELRQVLDPKYAHLCDDLHVEISALGPPAEAHARIAFALAEVRKYLIPDNNDNIRQEQIREMLEPIPPPIMPPGDHSARGRGRGGHRPVARTVVHNVPSVRSPTGPRLMPARTKIMSILDKARQAMEDAYCYDDAYESMPPGHMDDEPPVYHGRRPPHYPYDEPPHPRHDPYFEGPPNAGGDSYHYSRNQGGHEYGGTSSSHHRSYKPMPHGHGHNDSPVGMRRPQSANNRDNRYRSSPYARPNK